ncbi:MAG TPA: ABC transporter permease [Chthonomonadales bacterium]|nr:ABC transporter permease [Chthonomonadales bacterium]
MTENWLRSLLTISGVVVGVLSVVTLIAILQGVKLELSRQLEQLGANLVIVLPGKLDSSGRPNPMAMLGISTLRQADVQALRTVPGVVQISPIMFVSGTAALPGQPEIATLVVGTNRDGIDMNPTRLAEGAYFSGAQETERVCVLAHKPAALLFGARSAIGHDIKISGKRWRVVGVLRAPANDDTLGSSLMGLSNLIYIPYEAAKQTVPAGQINRIVLRTDYRHPADKLLGNLRRALLNSHRGQEDFGLLTQSKGLALVIKLLNMAQALLALIAAISLIVAGVGIMNIMLATVTERTREIGVRKTVGARRIDLFFQFLIEAMLLSLVGGALGVAIAYVVCAVVARSTLLTPVITGGAVVMALTVCIAVGALFGVAPAIRAGRLNPIDALRHE